jgi:hypothetical protein
VGFGCPVDGCGVPYLSYHHFEPPWVQGHSHEPEGMVALCLHHHKTADVGAFTDDQLRALKADPFVLRMGAPIRGGFEWRREQLVILSGSIWYFGCAVLLEARGRQLIWLSRDGQGHELLNLDLYSPDGSLQLAMRDNDWVVVGDLHDVECPPAANSLVVRAGGGGGHLSIRFDSADQERIERLARTGSHRSTDAALARLAANLAAQPPHQTTLPPPPPGFEDFERRMIEDIRARRDEQAEQAVANVVGKISSFPVPLCRITGRLVFPLPVRLAQYRTVLPGNNVIAGGLMAGSGTAISLN